MKTIIIQPPLVQLNSPYPSGAYLSSFFRLNGTDTLWLDLSIRLVRRIFSKAGLEVLFSKSEKKALELAQEYRRQGNEEAAITVRDFLLQSDLWIRSIDSIFSILTDGSRESGREFCHKFISSPFSPRGPRMTALMENMDHAPTTDDARNIACMAIADLADYITFTFDPNFSLVRYAESLTVSETSFSSIEESVESPVLKSFYQPILEEEFSGRTKASSMMEAATEEDPVLICISVPFAGTFTPALFTGKWLKEKFGKVVRISMGGGFINTELRTAEETALCRYTDFFSYDRGYGSYRAMMDGDLLRNFSGKKEYKLRQFCGDTIIPQEEKNPEYEHYENDLTAKIVPDYSDINFSLYPRLADDTNPMQRLWSDGTWLKAYLAHGCYWHRCAFCDTTLDYVKSYRMTGIENLFNGLVPQLKEHGLGGIHFVDEAMPPVAMEKFALLAAARMPSLSWWGNIRFEKTFTRDLADILSYGGLTGVSGGIEIATGSGLDSINKGTDIHSIVGACCALKEAGVLIHAYMIYGYYGESDQDTINSMETLRQFYQTGLLDSCFWHKFVLTRHSTVYDEWKNGKHKDLCPYEPKEQGILAKNGLHFKGEEKSEKFGPGLNAALQAWMHGDKLNMSVTKWFDFKVPSPTVPQDYVERAVEEYEERRDSLLGRIIGKEIDLEDCWWLGGKILAEKTKSGVRLSWSYMTETMEELIPHEKIETMQELIEGLYCLDPKKHGPDQKDRAVKLRNAVGRHQSIATILQKLRGRGLACARLGI